MSCQGVRGSYKGRSSVSMTLFNCLVQCCIGQFSRVFCGHIPGAGECDPVWVPLLSSPLSASHVPKSRVWPGVMEPSAVGPGLAWLGPIMSLTGFHFVGTWIVTQRGNCYFHPPTAPTSHSSSSRVLLSEEIWAYFWEFYTTTHRTL